MCRSIVSLRKPEGSATNDEVKAAALQSVRKISGYRTPSRANQAVFDAAIDEIAVASNKMFGSLRVGARVPASKAG